MRLAELFPGARIPEDAAQREVRGISVDSRNVGEDMVFFAAPGAKANGLGFAHEAARKGAIAIVAEADPEPAAAPAALIKVKDVRSALAQAAARVYPGQPETAVAVTGTSGKTSVAEFTRQIWAALGKSAASLGTLGVMTSSGAAPGALTTPDPVSLHKTLSKLASGGVTHLAMEASSHGLDQRRLDGVRLAAGAFTNLSRDHLDYHPSIGEYFAAKLRLFRELLSPGQPAVIDADSEAAPKVRAVCEAHGLGVLSAGFKGDDLRLLDAKPEEFSIRLTVAHGGKAYVALLPLAGSFQASNALVAAGLCIATGSPPGAVFAALEQLKGAPGRLELAGRRCGAPVFIDYAHKPDALEHALKAVRPFVQGKLIVVFGCGGDRDAGKRPLMGEAAARLADHVIITDDNPRSEDPGLIRKAILAGVRDLRKAGEVAGRAEAIARAIAMLGPRDGLVIAGKGHESGQIIGDTTLPFSDKDCVRAVLKDLSS
jgi:UDP-N-acetylmuramoyl-L-alanyl-D-glutamate--2,6-diaminopimelate ligase